MENLNVMCEICEKGKLFLKQEFRRNYWMMCDTCGGAFWGTQYSYDALLRESEYNGEEDVRVLNDNGNWSFVTMLEKGLNIEDYTAKMTKIHSAREDVFTVSYYRSGGNFSRFSKNSDGWVVMQTLRVNSIESIGNLIAHFEKLTPYPIDGKRGQI